MGNGLDVASPAFLSAQTGDFVVIEEEHESNWWMGYIIYAIKGARGSRQNSLFQIVNIDSGHIKTVNADQITKVLDVVNIVE